MKLTASLLGTGLASAETDSPVYRTGRLVDAREFHTLGKMASAGKTIETVSGAVYRVLASVNTPDGPNVRMARVGEQPITVTATQLYDMGVMTPGLRRIANVIRRIAYAREWDLYVKEAIKAAGLPVDKSWNWANWFQRKFVPALKTGDPDLQDELVFETLKTVLFERRALERFRAGVEPEGGEGGVDAEDAITMKNQNVLNEPLEKQVTMFLIKAFKYRIQEANRWLRNRYTGLNEDAEGTMEGMSMEQTMDDGEGEADVNILDTEEHATPFNSDDLEVGGEATNFRNGLSKYLHMTQRKKTADNLILLFDLILEAGGDSAYNAGYDQEWMSRTGLSKEQYKYMRSKLFEEMEKYISTHRDELGGKHGIIVKMYDVLKEQKEKDQKAKVHASSLVTAEYLDDEGDPLFKEEVLLEHTQTCKQCASALRSGPSNVGDVDVQAMCPIGQRIHEGGEISSEEAKKIICHCGHSLFNHATDNGWATTHWCGVCKGKCEKFEYWCKTAASGSFGTLGPDKNEPMNDEEPPAAPASGSQQEEEQQPQKSTVPTELPNQQLHVRGSEEPKFSSVRMKIRARREERKIAGEERPPLRCQQCGHPNDPRNKMCAKCNSELPWEAHQASKCSSVMPPVMEGCQLCGTKTASEFCRACTADLGPYAALPYLTEKAAATWWNSRPADVKKASVSATWEGLNPKAKAALLTDMRMGWLNLGQGKRAAEEETTEVTPLGKPKAAESPTEQPLEVKEAAETVPPKKPVQSVGGPDAAGKIVMRLIQDMSDDNGCHFQYTKEQFAAMTSAVDKLLAAGANLDREMIMEIAAGDQDYVQEQLGSVPGYAELNKLLNEIFDSPGGGAYSPEDFPVPDGYELIPELQEKKLKKVMSLKERVAAARQKSGDKFARLKKMAAEEAPEIGQALDQLGNSCELLAESFTGLRENLDLVEAPKTASIRERIASTRSYAATLKRVAEQAPEQLQSAVNDVYHALDGVARDLEAFADNLGIALTEPPIDEVEEEIATEEKEEGGQEGHEPKVDFKEEGEEPESKEAAKKEKAKCKFCGKEFTKKRSDDAYCSQKCQQSDTQAGL